MAIRIGQDAPNFTAKALIGKGEFTDVTLKKYAEEGKWVVLYFYPLDFTFVCPTEIRAFDTLAADFSKSNCQVVGASVDSHFSHKGWLESGGITPDKNLRHPIVSDITKNISRDYGVLGDAGCALRGTVIIDPKGKIRYYECNDAPVGRSPENILRVLHGLQYVESHGDEVCPVNWKPGSDTIKVG